MIEHTIATNLHVIPPVVTLATGDRMVRRFAAGKTITGRSVTMERLGTDPPVLTPALVELQANETDGLTVIIIGGDRGRSYLLTATFTAGAEIWSRQLTVRVRP
jgi:hypothetical protein